MRDTGDFFWFIFFSEKENEQPNDKAIRQIGRTAPGPPPEVEVLYQN
jgi:hypothetical protein